MLLLTGSETMFYELEDEGSLYDVSVSSNHSLSTVIHMIFVRPSNLGGLVAVIAPNCELSVIVTGLGCESIVCLDNYTQ